MTLDEVMAELEALGNEQTRKMNARHGAGENQFGVKMGDIRNLAKTIKTDHELALRLWKTGNLEAQLLATLIIMPKQLTAEEVDGLVRSQAHYRTAALSFLADWLMTNVVKQHPQKEELRLKWMTDSDPMIARAAWSLTAERISKNPDGLDTARLLDRIEREMGSAPAPAQWTMNYTLAEIGIHFPEHRERALQIGETLGVYRDYPVSKGCTSPFAPIWINFMVDRQSREG